MANWQRKVAAGSWYSQAEAKLAGNLLTSLNENEV